MCRICSVVKKKIHSRISVFVVFSFIWWSIKERSYPSSGNNSSKKETHEGNRGWRRYKRGSSTVIGVLLQRQSRKWFHLASLQFATKHWRKCDVFKQKIILGPQKQLSKTREECWFYACMFKHMYNPIFKNTKMLWKGKLKLVQRQNIEYWMK